MFGLYETGPGASFRKNRTRYLDFRFGITELSNMTITEYRASHGLTMEAFAALIERSKGHMSEIESTGRCNAKLALAIERVTGGQVDAASLNDEVADARKQAA